MDGDNIIGFKKWGLPALKQAIRQNQLRSFEEIVADPNFYGKDHLGLNAAQARYLLMYLQEKHLLQKYYRDFRAAAKDDPTGIKTLKALIAPKTLEDFERDWRAWVLSL